METKYVQAADGSWILEEKVFDESKHPRVAVGTSEGGEFTKSKFEIAKHINPYNKREIYQLYENGVNVGEVSEKTLAEFLKRGIALNDSRGIESYLKYNNL